MKRFDRNKQTDFSSVTRRFNEIRTGSKNRLYEHDFILLRDPSWEEWMIRESRAGLGGSGGGRGREWLVTRR